MLDVTNDTSIIQLRIRTVNCSIKAVIIIKIKGDIIKRATIKSPYAIISLRMISYMHVD